MHISLKSDPNYYALFKERHFGSDFNGIEIMRIWQNTVKTKRKYILRSYGLGEILSRQRENIFWDNADLVKYCQDKEKIYFEIMRIWRNIVKTKRKYILRSCGLGEILSIKTKRKYIWRSCGLGEILSRQRENIFWDHADLVKYRQDKEKIYFEIMRIWNTAKTKRRQRENADYILR